MVVIVQFEMKTIHFVMVKNSHMDYLSITCISSGFFNASEMIHAEVDEQAEFR